LTGKALAKSPSQRIGWQMRRPQKPACEIIAPIAAGSDPVDR
jgi:hypothetical protein